MSRRRVFIDAHLASRTENSEVIVKPQTPSTPAVKLQFKDEAENKVVYDPSSLYYDMSGNKLMIIFNHYEFKTSMYFGVPLEKREGTFSDVENLQNTFKGIGFQVQTFHDSPRDKIFNIISDLCKMDHQKTSCVSVVLLTHGDYNEVYAADMTYSVDSMINLVRNERKLAGKPKLFFIQACRGGSFDSGHQIYSTDSVSSVTIPTHADCFVMNSSFLGHVSFRTASGTWMIQELCKAVKEHYKKDDILSIATRVCFHVAALVVDIPEVPRYHLKKQTVITSFTLSKYLYLNGAPEECNK